MRANGEPAEVAHLSKEMVEHMEREQAERDAEAVREKAERAAHEAQAKRQAEAQAKREQEAQAAAEETQQPAADPAAAPRTQWQAGFPPATILRRPEVVQSHPDYRAAKDGDWEAAARLVADIVTEADIDAVKQMLAGRGDVVVAVHAEEASGRNKIPLLYAALLADRAGLRLDDSIVQARKVNRGGSDGFHRIATQIPFAGTVDAGTEYLIVDDTLAQGGTLASLRGYIESKGGTVVGATALMGKQYSATLAPTSATLDALRAKYGAAFEQWWKDEFGYGFDRLTESEARYLASLRGADADAVRNRILAARQGRDGSEGAGALQGAAPSNADQVGPPAQGGIAASANTVFTEDAAAAARARLKAKLGRLNAGIDPEMLMDGITLAGYHIERGARTFAAYAKAMVADLGDGAKPFLKSWYMGVKYDPRAAGFDGMDSATTVDAADVDALLAPQEAPKPGVRTELDAAAHEAATSPLNDLPQPSDEMKAAGNYKVGRVRLHGLDISIENPKGSVRSGVSPDGTRWENVLHAHYGYVLGTKAADGDHLDVFLTDDAEAATVAWVIDQKNQDGAFDEHKIVIGPQSEAAARAAYLANYDAGWDGLGAITSMPMEAFKAWALDGKKKRKPLAYVEPTPAPYTLLGAEPFAQIEEGRTALILIGDKAALKERLDALGVKFLPRRDGVSVPNRKHWGDVRASIPVQIERYRVAGVPERLAEVSVETLSDGTVRLMSPVEISGGPSAEAVLTRYAQNYADAPADASPFDDVAERVADEPVHQDPGEPAALATAPVIAEALRTSARNTAFDPVEAKQWLLAEIDRAIKAVPEANAERAAELEREKAATFDEKAAMRHFGRDSKKISAARDAFEAAQADRIAKTAKQIGFVTFDVPGDGKFKVVNTVENLTAFRKRVDASPGFSKNVSRPLTYGSGLAGGLSLDQAIADAKKFGGDPLAEIGNAIEVARLKKSKGEDALLERFREASGGKDYDAWRAEQEAAEEIAAREAADQSATDDFVLAPDGSIDFGEIPPEMAQAMRRQPGAIRLERGDGSFGLQHIEERHGAQIRGLGFDSVESFVFDAVQHIDAVWKPAKTRQLVVLQSVRRGKAVFIELKPADSGDYYTVNTAFPVSDGYAEKKEGGICFGAGRPFPPLPPGLTRLPVRPLMPVSRPQ